MEDDDNDTFIISEGSFGAYEKKVWIPVKEFHNYNAYPKFFNEELLNLGENVKLISSI